MKNHSLLLLAAAFGLTAVPVSAAVTTVNDSQSAETAYTVTSGDLLESATVAAQSGWTTNNGSDYNELTDGAYGSIYVSGPIEIDGAWDNPAGTATITYDLDLSGAGGGYDITSIVSYAGWSSASLGQQVITVEYSTVGSAGWTSLGTGTNQPASGSVSTRVTFEDDTNPGVDVIASGVDAIRFTSGDWTVFREFDVIGTATTGGDTTDPEISTLSPVDGATGVAISSNLVVTFDENIAIGTGNITIKNLDAPSQDAIPVGDSQVSVVGAVLTINPTSSLDPDTNYAIQIDATAMDDLAGNSFAGITDDTTWNFTTAPVDGTAPTVSTLSPPDGSTDVAANSTLVVTFDEDIAIGTGDITIKDLDTPSQIAIPVSDGQVSTSGAVLTINPTADLAASTNYAIQIASTAITDLAGNPFAGIADDTTWNFATATPPTEDFSTTQFTYAGDVSASDLLHGLTPITTGWNTGNNASPLELTDGIHGVGFNGVPGDAVQGAWTTVGATAEYDLGLSPGGAGWDITSVQSIADWVNVGFGNQAWTLEVKPVGGSYTTLATVDYQPLGSGGGTTKVTLMDPSGVLATGIQCIKVTANQVNGGANAGAFVWRELDVFGVATNDLTNPQIATLDPADGGTGVTPNSDLVATFDENIVIGTGNITIKDLDTPSQDPIPVTDGQISVSGAVLTINPTADLASGTNYAIQIDATAIEDASGNPFAGIADDTTWNFTTGVPDTTNPMISTLSPLDGASNVPLAGNLVVTFDEDILAGTGNITIKNLDAPSQDPIPVTDGQISVSGAVLTIDPTSNLTKTTNYAVQIDATAITDLSGNPFAGIADDTTWNFVTADEPLRIMAMGDSITAGYTDNPTWNEPYWYGYRSGLYNRLTAAGYNFTFVGQSGELLDHFPAGTVPPADLNALGQNSHNGYGGAAVGLLNANILTWLANDEPDIILLKIGTNSQDQSGLDTLVNTITTQRPNLHLIIAEIMPKWTYQQGIVNYNTYIRDTLVPTYQGLGRNVSVVDQYAPFLTNPADLTSIDQSLISNGINHPDNVGYDKMAQVWFDGIEKLGIGPNSFPNWISGFPAVGGQTGLNDDPDGDGVDSGVENFFGTDPSSFSKGLVAGAVSGGTFSFTHPQSSNPAPELNATYRWSTNLASFHNDGDSSGGTTVDFSVQADTPQAGVSTVTATVSGTPITRLFVDVEVTD